MADSHAIDYESSMKQQTSRQCSTLCCRSETRAGVVGQINGARALAQRRALTMSILSIFEPNQLVFGCICHARTS
jgi:hypothetical protein